MQCTVRKKHMFLNRGKYKRTPDEWLETSETFKNFRKQYIFQISRTFTENKISFSATLIFGNAFEQFL